MFETLKNVFRVKEMRRKLLYLIWMIFIIRIGCQIPVPGVDSDFFKQWFSSNAGDAFNFFDAFTGGSFERMSIFALNITPYITSSIIIQLLTIAIPALEEMQRDGEEGRKKMTAITRYVTVGLALFESIAMAIGFGRQGMIPNLDFFKGVVVVACLTAGSAMLMWLGERITEKGVGNGISIVLTINIISRVPSDLTLLYENFIKGKTIAKGTLAGLIIAAVILLVVVLVLILNGAERRIPVQYSKKMVGRKLMGGQSTNIPLKVNTAGVIPVIFASSIMSFPAVIAQESEVRLFVVFLPITGVIRNSSSIHGDWFFTSYFVFSLHISTLPLHSILWKLQIISKSRVDLFRVFVLENLRQTI